MDLTELYDLFRHHPQITTDSRNCPTGSLFFALKGEKFDGNKFAHKALISGCDYAIIDNPEYVEGERTILVENVLLTLQQLAHRHRKALGIPIIGITGTNGKTTTKELVSAVLSSKFNLLYTEGNLNNHIGVPLTLLQLNYQHEIAIIEMGASHPGDIKELTEMVCPNYGIITNIGNAHLEGFGSLENVLSTKGELFDYLRAHHGKVFINKEDKYLMSIANNLDTITYGIDSSAFAYGEVESSDPYLSFYWVQQGKKNIVQTQLVGDYNLMNAIAAVAVGRFFKIPSARITRAISSYKPQNNRSQLQETTSNKLIIDTYNANPTSTKAAIKNFKTMNAPKKAVILGDMKELGNKTKDFHHEIIQELEPSHFDKIYLCGEYFSDVTKEEKAFISINDLIEELKINPIKGYLILIKGSRSMELEKILPYL